MSTRRNEWIRDSTPRDHRLMPCPGGPRETGGDGGAAGGIDDHASAEGIDEGQCSHAGRRQSGYARPVVPRRQRVADTDGQQRLTRPDSYYLRCRSCGALPGRFSP